MESRCPQCNEPGREAGVRSTTTVGTKKEQCWYCGGCDKWWFTDYYPDKCTLCSGYFDLDQDGGVEGELEGMDFKFCPGCLNGLCGLVDEVSEPCTCGAAREIVEEQAEDPRLWFHAETAPEDYVQQALRKLHAAVEGKVESCDSTKH